MTWSAYKRWDGDDIWLNLAGDVSDGSVQPLRSTIVDTIALHRPGRLLVDLRAVRSLVPAGVSALMTGYVAAIDHGVTYQVTGAEDEVRAMMAAAGVLDVLSDSEDIGSLLLAISRLRV